MRMQSRTGKRSGKSVLELPVFPSASAQPLWQFDFAEVTGHNLELRGRKEVNRLLAAGWRLLHVYTLRYEENGIWRERPMAILGRPRGRSHEARKDESLDTPRKPTQKTAALFRLR